MPMWVQLKRNVRLDPGGKPRDYYPGDWVKVGKSLAQQWIADGTAIMPYPQATQVEEPAGSAGVMTFWGTAGLDDLGIPVENDAKYELRWEKTLLWDVRAQVEKYLIPLGFKFLDKWQIAVPLWDYRELAEGEGTEEERERTKEVIHDLRVPLYDTRLLFVRRCPETRALLELWENESGGNMDKLSFLRVLYKVKPLILALPTTWSGQWAPGQ